MTTPTTRRLLLCLALAAGCGSDPSPQTGTSDDASTGMPTEDTASESTGAADGDSSGAAQVDVTYFEDVRPLLTEHCVACHVDGSIAPFRLDTFDDVVSLAPAIRTVIEARTMPPFGVKADGSCQDYADPRWMTDEEIATVGAWIDQGMAAGDDTLAAPEPPELPTLEGDTELVAIPEYTPVTHEDIGFALDDYRCFPIEFDGESDRYLTGFDVDPDNDAIVHHVLGFRVDPTFLNNASAMEALEALDDEPGWPCYGAAGDGILPQGVPVTWAPGQGAVNYPEGVGVRFEPGDVMVVQMHYNLLEEDAGNDATQVRLKWEDEVETEGYQVLWDPFLIQAFTGGSETLAPGMESVKYNWDATFTDMFQFDGLSFAEINLLGVIPHMHARGRKMSLQIERSGEMECAADVDRYDYNWQRTYFYETPIHVDAEDRLHVECDFNTMGASEPISAGFGTQDEMCLVGLFFTE